MTDPEVTRYFMTIGEAVRLVVASGGAGRSGEVLVLDMGEPVRIAEVAVRVAAQVGRPARIVYTGLRPGEKLHEVLFSPEERPTAPVHPMIRHVAVPALSPDQLVALNTELPAGAQIKQLNELAGLISLDSPRPQLRESIGPSEPDDDSNSSVGAIQVGR